MDATKPVQAQGHNLEDNWFFQGIIIQELAMKQNGKINIYINPRAKKKKILEEKCPKETLLLLPTLQSSF